MTNENKVFKPFPELPKPLFDEYKQSLLDNLTRVIDEMYDSPNPSSEATRMRWKMAGYLYSIKDKWTSEDRPQFIQVPLGPVLDELGLPPSIKAPLLQASSLLQPDLDLTYQKADPQELKTIAAEGRGVYHSEVVDGLPCSVYVKGVGSQDLLGTSDSADLFPAYPRSSENLFFDDPFNITNGHPRIIGTETALWGVHDHINSAILFSQAVKHLGIKDFQSALEAQIPIPIGVKEHPDLSLYLQSFLAQKYQESKNQIEKDHLAWLGNWQPFVTVATIVPGQKRLERISQLSTLAPDELVKTGQLLVDPARSGILGRCTHTLIDMGMVFSFSSSHGQNIYDAPESKLPVADYSDLLLLGSFNDKSVELFSDTGITHLSQSERQTYAISQTLSRTDGQRPLHADFNKFGVTYDQALAANQVYWSEITTGYGIKIDPTELAKMSLYFGDYFTQAVSSSIVEHTPPEIKVEWTHIAEKQRQIFRYVDDTGTLQDTLDGRIEANADDISVFIAKSILNSPRTRALQKYLEGGDIAVVNEHPDLSAIFKLMNVIDTVADPQIRTDLASAFSRLQSRRSFVDLEYNLDSPKLQRDLVYLFENKHLDRAGELISTGQYAAAERLLKTLVDLQTTYVDEGDVHPEDDRTNKKTLVCRPPTPLFTGGNPGAVRTDRVSATAGRLFWCCFRQYFI